jgi:hypothetical protein
MRRTLSLCRSGLAAAAAVVLLTACGGGDDDSNASDGTTSSSSSSASETAENTAPQADSEFCVEASAILQRVVASLTSTDQSQVGEVLQQASQEIQDIEPPAEIATDWSGFVDATAEFAAISQIDFEDPAAYQQWQQQTTQIQAEHGAALANVQSYLATQCGVADEEVTESSSPTS